MSGAGTAERMVLDPLESMAAARQIFASLGFVETAPYHANPLAGARFMALELASATGSLSAHLPGGR